MITSETYEIIGEIGKGSGGVVYKAFNKNLKKEVVIKQIINKGSGISNRTETDIIKNLKHSYLPQVLDFIEDGEEAYTVMDFIPGSDIDRLVRGGRVFRYKEIVNIGIQLCEAVEYLHNCKPPIIHSDIKPGNVMLSDEGNICLIDFNVSLVFDKKSRAVGGTPGYAPPEQLGIPLSAIRAGINGELPIGQTETSVNERSDIYSIGATLYFLAAGERPAVNFKVRPLSETGRKVSDGLIHIISKAMELDPAKRFKSASEMLQALKNIGKLDRRYKALKIRRTVVTIAAAVLMFVCVSTNRLGAEKLLEEREEKYLGYVSEMKSSVENRDFSAAEEIIEKARALEPSRIEPYYNTEKILHENQKYEECMVYPDSVLVPDILNNEKNSAVMKAEMYEMAADSAFELEKYSEAAALYEKTIFYSDVLTDCYRDLGISYARSGDVPKAEYALERARELNVSNDSIELMQGEINAAKGDFTAAYESFRKTLEITENDYVRFRALLACDNAAASQGENAEDITLKMIGLISKEMDKVSDEYLSVVTEMLAGDCAKYAELTENNEYYCKAADCYERLLNEDKLGYSLMKNYFNILFSKLKSYNECEALLNKMSGINPEDYWIEMSRSYLYISVENEVENHRERDYSKAYASYLNAVEQYKEFTRSGKTDPNMDNLTAAVNELKSFGWI